MQSTSLGTNGAFVLRVGLDLTDTESSGFAFAHAVRVARRIAQSRLQVVYVRDEDSTADVSREAAGLLNLYLVEKWDSVGRPSAHLFGVHGHLGDAARQIAQVAAEVIVVGGREIPHLKAIFMGSAAERLCPVLVAESRPKRTPSRQSHGSA
jgi:nucleotide-binding universal stress UspA family protein